MESVRAATRSERRDMAATASAGASVASDLEHQPDERDGDRDKYPSEPRGAGESERGGAEALESALAQLGHFGLYQRYVLLMLCLPNLLAAMHSLNYVFVADRVSFR